ncbi:MAG: histone deacetylase family protein [Rhodospirillales bacterium]|nr:histone deacetylase family protein [Rhodospirillales bacterium]MCB9995270.1 histone deacetylase family protein [Rhodospirillales bacterium]
MKTNIYKNTPGLRHDTGPNHPECIARLESVLALFDAPPFDALPVIEAQPAEEDTIALAHDHAYINRLLDSLPDQGTAYLDADTVICPASWDAALSAAGAVCQAVDDIAAGNATRAFCAVRPPGHHAVPDKAMGFCLFNNIFIGARHAQERHNVRRISIIDFDVHHGNGTDAMTRKAEDIFYISSHQAPFYPGTGDPKYDVPGKTLNIPLPAGTGSTSFRTAYEQRVFPAIDAFKPDLMMISAGFDAHKDDPLAALELTDEDYGWVTAELCNLANIHCDGKIVSVLEGGYNLDALKTAVAAHLKALI